MIAYKLMNQDFTTHNGFKWEIGKKETIDIPGAELCSNQVFHAYKSPELAVLFNPIHAYYRDPILIKIECDIVADDGLKIGSKWQKPIELIPLPEITARERTVFAILCAKSISHLLDAPIEQWDDWANSYLNDSNSPDARAADAAANAAAYANAAYAAANAAYAARAAVAAYAAAAVSIPDFDALYKSVSNYIRR